MNTPFNTLFSGVNQALIMDRYTSSNATVALLKAALNDGINISTSMHPQGYDMIKVNGLLSDIKQARALASIKLSAETQVAIAAGLRNDILLMEVLSAALGGKPVAGAGFIKNTLKVSFSHVSLMSSRFLADMAIPQKDEANASALVSSIFAELFQSMGSSSTTHYVEETPLTHFFAPIMLKDELADPFSAALTIERIVHSPFRTFELDKDTLEGMKRSEGRHHALGDMVAAITRGAQKFMTEFRKLGDKQAAVIVGLQIASDVLQRRVDVPPGFNDHEVLRLLRTNLTFHNLCLDKEQGGFGMSWDSSIHSSIRDMVKLTREIAAGSEGDDMLARKTALYKESLSKNTYLDRLAEFMNEYITFYDIRTFADYFGIEQFVATDDTNTVSAVRVWMDRDMPKLAPVFTGLQFDLSAGGKTRKIATLTRSVMDFSLPLLPESAMMDTITQQIMNMNKAEVAKLVESYVGSYVDGESHSDGDDFTLGGMILPLPGTAVNLITNMNELDHASYIDFSSATSADSIKVPYLVYLFAAALSHEFTFTPNQPIEFTRKSEIGTPLRTAQSQLSDVISYDKNEITTINPLHILVVTQLDSRGPKHKFTVENPQVDLAALVGEEFMMDVSAQSAKRMGRKPIHRFIAPTIPRKRSDRLALVGREKSAMENLADLRPQAIVDGVTNNSVLAKVSKAHQAIETSLQAPFIVYRSRYVDTSKGTKGAVISAPIDLHQIFGFYEELYVSSIVTHVDFDSSLNSLLDALESLPVVFPNSKSDHVDRLIDLVEAVAGSYIRVGVARADVQGLDTNSKQQIDEFATMYGLGVFADLAVRLALLERETAMRLIAAVENMPDAQFARVARSVIALVAKRHTGVE